MPDPKAQNQNPNLSNFSYCIATPDPIVPARMLEAFHSLHQGNANHSINTFIFVLGLFRATADKTAYRTQST